MHNTLPLLEVTDFPAITRRALTTLQVNLGYRCNQSCVHCHVNAGPTRTEMMEEATIQLLVDIMQARQIHTLDITGGAPEMHPQFRWLVTEAVRLGVKVMDRCNLTILLEPGQEDLGDFLAQHKVSVVASLPCYTEANVDKQRGAGVFGKSINALKQLNALGYGVEGSGLTLDLVYNPGGAFLPGAQGKLEADYKRQLGQDFGIVFNHLFTLTNMPIKRFGSMLVSQGQFEPYMQLLKDNFNAATLGQVMCRDLVSVDWQGALYDCDFNQMLGLPLPGKASHLRDLLATGIAGQAIAVADHCYGCTAGAGSSCGGALA